MAAALPDDGTAGRRAGLEHAASVLVTTGMVTVPGAAAAGFVDWAQLHPGQKRVGAVHAAANVVGSGLLAASLVARLRGRHGRGRLLGLLGVAVAGSTTVPSCTARPRRRHPSSTSVSSGAG